MFEGRTIPSCAEPTYLGVKLNRTLTFQRRLESMHRKLTSRVKLLERVEELIWLEAIKTLRTTILALVHSTAEYCVPAWCRSNHIRLINKPIHDAVCYINWLPAYHSNG